MFKERNKNGNLRLRYSGGPPWKGSLNGRSPPTASKVSPKCGKWRYKIKPYHPEWHVHSLMDLHVGISILGWAGKANHGFRAWSTPNARRILFPKERRANASRTDRFLIAFVSIEKFKECLHTHGSARRPHVCRIEGTMRCVSDHYWRNIEGTLRCGTEVWRDFLFIFHTRNEYLNKKSCSQGSFENCLHTHGANEAKRARVQD
jgi:hypothetical protein